MTMAICSGAIATASATFNSSNDERERKNKTTCHQKWQSTSMAVQKKCWLTNWSPLVNSKNVQFRYVAVRKFVKTILFQHVLMHECSAYVCVCACDMNHIFSFWCKYLVVVRRFRSLSFFSLHMACIINDMCNKYRMDLDVLIKYRINERLRQTRDVDFIRADDKLLLSTNERQWQQ